jgi:hypothetical protein
MTVMGNFVKRINTHGSVCSKEILKYMLPKLGLRYNLDWRFYRIWSNMRTRTTNPNYEKKHRYADRGINSDYFRYFVDFYDSMYASYVQHVAIYGEHDTTLDRINNDDSYYPENCKWSTLYEQANNRGDLLSFKATDPNGKVYYGENLLKFCNEHDLVYGTAQALLSKINIHSRNGWKFDKV